MKKIIGKYKLLLTVECLFIVASFLLCFGKTNEIEFINNEDIVHNNQGNSFCKEIELQPGVYRVSMNANVPEGASLYLDVKAEEGYNQLLCNGATYFAGLDKLDFEAYVLKHQNVQLRCDAKGVDISCVDCIGIESTNIGWRIICFLIVLISFILNYMIYLRKQILSGNCSRQKQIVISVLTATVLLVYLPLCSDYFYRGADTDYHLLRIEFLKDSILTSNTMFPIRIQSGWLMGHGYATSVFYGDIILLIPAVLRIIGFSLMTSYKSLILIKLIATAWITWKCFRLCSNDDYAALFGTVLYMTAPYHLFNLYGRGAVGEFLAMIFFPMVISGIYILYMNEDKNKQNVAQMLLIIGFSGLLLNHVISTEITLMFVVLFCCFAYKKTFTKSRLACLFRAGCQTLLLNVWFWLPFLQMMFSDSYYFNSLSNNRIQSKGITLTCLFELIPYPMIYIATPVLPGAACFILLAVYVLKIRNKQVVTNICAFLVIITLWMSTCYFPWDCLAQIPIVKVVATTIQFPTRMMAFVVLFVAFFGVLLFEKIKVEMSKYKACICFAAIYISAILTSIYYLNMYSGIAGVTRLHTAENMGTISIGNGEYLLTDTDFGDYYYHEPLAHEGISYSNYEKNGLNISLRVENSLDCESYIELPVMGYKGYCIKSESGSAYITADRGRHGDLKVAIAPKYSGYINVFYPERVSWKVADFISILTLLFLVANWCKVKRCTRYIHNYL